MHSEKRDAGDTAHTTGDARFLRWGGGCIAPALFGLYAVRLSVDAREGDPRSTTSQGFRQIPGMSVIRYDLREKYIATPAPLTSIQSWPSLKP